MIQICLFCKTPLPSPPPSGASDWGDWKCEKCGVAYCQDCGSQLDYNDECIAYLEFMGRIKDFNQNSLNNY